MPSTTRPVPRRGIAMMFVLVLSVVVLAVGMSMIGLSGNVLSASADTKAKIKARYAAESAISAAIADAVYQASAIFGGTVTSSTRSVSAASGFGVAGISSGNSLGQEVILQKKSAMNNLRGNKIPLRIEATGKSGGAKARISASVALYQVPIYQFGVFYEGPLEITPGPDMYVMGRVHCNSSAYFRGIASLKFQGPVTVVGNIYQWYRSSAGSVKYLIKPDTTVYYAPPLTTNLSAMTTATQPSSVGGVRYVRFQETRLTLAIGSGDPHSILGVRNAADGAALRRQKFDWLVASRSSSSARFVYAGSGTTRPSWITGPYAFFDRREQRWVKVWDFDVSALSAAGNADSIFYLDDTTTSMEHVSGSTRQVLNAFRIKNASVLPRNMTIACGKPVYVMGNFNTQNSSGDTSKYKNAQIASDAVTVLSAQWPNWAASKIGSNSITKKNSSLEQNWSNSNWLASPVLDSSGYAQVPTGTAIASDLRINAAVITGNKQSSASCLSSTTENAFEACYEGGWHNSLRFLESWGDSRTVTFKGSFVCLWEAQTPQLRSAATGKVLSTSYYSPPTRVWGYDTRFDDLSNMPPGAPFLATAILTNWLELN